MPGRAARRATRRVGPTGGGLDRPCPDPAPRSRDGQAWQLYAQRRHRDHDGPREPRAGREARRLFLPCDGVPARRAVGGPRGRPRDLGRPRRDPDRARRGGIPAGGKPRAPHDSRGPARRRVPGDPEATAAAAGGRLPAGAGAHRRPDHERPGHPQAAIAAYPELGNKPDTLPVWTAWGVDENILNPGDATIRFEQNVLTEVMALFPGRWIHVGGDEAPKTQWKASPLAQARIRELGLKDEDELQSYFTRRMDEFLTAHGRSLVGWDEILEGGLAPNAVVMSWRGIDGGIAAARAGHDVVMAPGSHTYFDHYQAADTSTEPLAIGGFLPLDSVYAYDPVPA